MAKKTKLPPPENGDRVRLRGRGGEGWLMHINERKWAFVWWDYFNEVMGFDYWKGPWRKEGPRIVHLDELERIAA